MRYSSTAVEFPNENSHKPNVQKRNQRKRGGWALARLLAFVWCPLRGRVLCSLRPPAQPPENPHAGAGMQRARRTRSGLRHRPRCAHYLPSPPPLYGGERCPPPDGRGLFCAVSGASRPRPLGGLNSATLLRAAFALVAAVRAPPSLYMAAYILQAAIYRSGGRAPRGGALTRPPAARPAPQLRGLLWRAFVAGFCAVGR